MDLALVMVDTHVPVPEQPPPAQPANVLPPGTDAVRVTTVLCAKPAAHVEPQDMPATLLVTVPLAAPVPVLLTVRV